jgi:4-carboxymuconolactone decarboxylase
MTDERNDTREERYRRGIEQAEKLFGPDVESLVDTLGDLGRYVVELGFGDVYTRPGGLSPREREIALIGYLIGTPGLEGELRFHVQAALAVGITAAELEELVLQMAVYAGFPTALRALLVIREFTESGE